MPLQSAASGEVRTPLRTPTGCEMNPAASRVLGSLTHRAILMPYTKPKYLGFGAGVFDVRSEADTATQVLLAALPPDCAPAELWSRGRLLVDLGGPYWAGLVDDFFALSGRDQGRVRRLLPGTVAVAAHALAEDICEYSWKWAWSEVAIFEHDPEKGIPAVTRPDLVLGRGRQVSLVDLKVWGDIRKPDNDFDWWRRDFEARKFRVKDSWLLVVNTHTMTSQWVEVRA